MSDILTKIAMTTRDYVNKRMAEHPISDVEDAASNAPAVRGFHRNLVNAEVEGKFGLVTEIKKASPSKGLIREDFDPPSLARQYETGGASCLSVLTDQPYFMGSDEYLIAARGAVNLPVLRKDFMLDPYQVIEARAIGADCILLILAMIDDVLAAELEAVAMEHKLDVLVEVHNANELERAHKLQSNLIGINNRDLKTFEVSLNTTIKLAALADSARTLVSESGLFSHDDLTMVRETCGINSFLIGEALMRQENVEMATRKLLSA